MFTTVLITKGPLVLIEKAYFYFSVTRMKSISTCTLPPVSDLLAPPRSSVLGVPNLLSPSPVQATYYYHHQSSPSYSQAYSMQTPLKAKRKRASPAQLSVLNRVFSQTYFPSTELRIELGKQLGMSPRAVQIWFQNKRQSMRTRERQQQQEAKMASPASYQHPYSSSPSASTLPPVSPPLSPPSWHQRVSLDEAPDSRPSHISLPPLQLPSTPSSSAYPSPASIDSIILHWMHSSFTTETKSYHQSLYYFIMSTCYFLPLPFSPLLCSFLLIGLSIIFYPKFSSLRSY